MIIPIVVRFVAHLPLNFVNCQAQTNYM